MANSMAMSSATHLLIDEAKPLEPALFPNPPRNGSNLLPATIQNVLYLLKAYGIIVRYDVIKKKLHITIPGYSGSPDNADNVAMAHIISLANLNCMAIGQIPSFVEVLADRHQINPVADWITCKPWDGEDRLQAFYNTLIEREDYPEPLKQVLMHRWAVSAVAAAFKPSGFRARGILTLQGPQSIGKSAWVNALVPDPILREQLVKLDQHLDAGNKDSILTAISHWIVEIGELDGAFKKDIARLKGFLTGDRDKIRRPYGRTDSEYPRRTVFCATVNDEHFLVDATGNTRWWTIPVTRVDYSHNIDMQQLFAQVLVDFKKGAEWWLTKAEEGCLESFNQSHRSISAIRERILDAIDPDKAKDDKLPAMTPTALLNCIGIKSPTNGQCKECGMVLREVLGEPKRIRGQNKWRIPFINKEFYSIPAESCVPVDDDDAF